MNYFYSTNGNVIKSNIIEGLSEEDEQINLIDYMNKIDMLESELSELKSNFDTLRSKYNITLSNLPNKGDDMGYKFITDTVNDWKYVNNSIYIEVTLSDIIADIPYVYVNVIENGLIDNNYSYSVANVNRNSFRVYLNIEVDNKLEFVKSNLSLNYLVIG